MIRRGLEALARLGRSSPLAGTLLLSEGRCPGCGRVTRLLPGLESTLCPDCRAALIPPEGAACPGCGQWPKPPQALPELCA
ncbi:MAG: hypothetical protein KJ701_08185, partial [Proteobacteria bacterium]|nr:hypothetical protein [Pseudomonadota bacterium]